MHLQFCPIHQIIQLSTQYIFQSSMREPGDINNPLSTPCNFLPPRPLEKKFRVLTRYRCYLLRGVLFAGDDVACSLFGLWLCRSLIHVLPFISFILVLRRNYLCPSLGAKIEKYPGIFYFHLMFFHESVRGLFPLNNIELCL